MGANGPLPLFDARMNMAVCLTARFQSTAAVLGAALVAYDVLIPADQPMTL